MSEQSSIIIKVVTFSKAVGSRDHIVVALTRGVSHHVLAEEDVSVIDRVANAISSRLYNNAIFLTEDTLLTDYLIDRTVEEGRTILKELIDSLK